MEGGRVGGEGHGVGGLGAHFSLDLGRGVVADGGVVGG